MYVTNEGFTGEYVYIDGSGSQGYQYVLKNDGAGASRRRLDGDEHGDEQSDEHGAGNGFTVLYMPHALGDAAQCLAVGDVNVDDRLDLVIGVSSSQDTNTLITQDASGASQLPCCYKSAQNGFTQTSLSGGTRQTRSVALGDVTGDGVIDLVIGNSDYDNQLMVGDGNGGFEEPMLLPGGSSTSTYAIALGDFTGDGVLDILVGNSGQANTLIYAAGGSFVASEILGSHSLRTEQIALHENSNGGIDVYHVGINGYGQHVVDDGSGSYTQQNFQVSPHTSKTYGVDVALADVNADGVDDILVATTSSGLRLFTISSSGSTTMSTLLSSPGYKKILSIALGDFNGDGAIDVVAGENGYDNYLLLNDGAGSFSSSSLAGGSMATYDVAVGDLTNDGSASTAALDTCSTSASLSALSRVAYLDLLRPASTGANSPIRNSPPCAQISTSSLATITRRISSSLATGLGASPRQISRASHGTRGLSLSET